MSRFLEEDGQGMVEYALIIALIAVGCIAVFTLLGKNIAKKGKTVSDKLGADTEYTGTETDGTQPGGQH